VSIIKSANAAMQFPQLQQLPWLVHGFIPRQPGINVEVSKTEALGRLGETHAQILQKEGVVFEKMRTAEQVHGNSVATIGDQEISKVHPGVDGLATIMAGTPLGIYVADCCAIYLVDTEKKAMALLHSGKKGTETNIAQQGVQQLKTEFNAKPESIIAVLSPCIHSCHYEVDFVSEIRRQLYVEGVQNVFESPDCTACHLDRYYSYRQEKGMTGRMLAFMMKRF
jgi:copper oxidase (laccase) domain-containing protein